MKEENEINEEVKQLLDSLEQHGRNARRQQELSNLIDGLAVGTDTKRRRLIPLWWVVGAAAACLLLWLLVKPAVDEIPKVEETILVEEMENVGSIQSNTHEEALEEPIAEEELMANNATDKQPNTQNSTKETQDGLLRFARNDGGVEVAEATEAIKTHDTMNIGSNIIPTSTEEKLPTANCQLPTANCQLPTSSAPKRRVIRSLNLVCYECQKDFEEPHLSTLNSQPSTTIFGQPQDPNMKNGSLAFELKLQ